MTFIESLALWAVVFLAGEGISLYILFGVIGMGGLEELSRYEAGATFFYKLNPVTKMYIQLATTVVVYSAPPLLTSGLTVLMLVAFFTLSDGSRKYQLAFWLMILTFIASFWGMIDPFPRGGFYGLSAYNLAFPSASLTLVGEAFYQASKTMLVLLASLIIVLTTTPSQVLRVLEKLKIPLFVTFSIIVAMRELPRLFRAMDTIMKVQFMRGFGSKSPAPLRPFYMLAAFLLGAVPVMVYVLRGAKTTAVAADTRAFRTYSRRTNMSSVPFRAIDGVIVLVLTLGITVLLV
ncbi:MAG: energy-coupling factor transporter transmembrane protein EcfT [Candidatus Marsarchaeota archaeon]|nr:energy-coupling factor transporter transmembrane protein EcfT [Candidatus Marsarchaeota archaeon]